MSEEINEILGTQMEWDRMLQEDLELLHELVECGALAEPMAKQYVKKNGSEKFEESVDNWRPGDILTKVL